MNRIRLILYLLFLHACVIAQDHVPVTHVFIIGTIHTGNAYFDDEELVNIFKRLEPDIILWEQSDEFRIMRGLELASTLQIISPSIEQLAIQKYIKYNKVCRVLPYDTGFNREKYLSNELRFSSEIEQELHRKMINGSMTETDSLEYQKYLLVDSVFFDVIMDTTLERINRKDIMQVTGFLKELDGSIVLGLVNRYVDERYLQDWYKDDLVFWKKRNEFMCKRLMEHLAANKGKKIIVLCGLLHKYYINNYLSRLPATSDTRIQTTSD
ncbi:MAG TPA: hypothetical protein VK166_00355 [Chitinophagaceae bacterium]|nr:hypothetical protein [Chitinophagaceae bacterium]